MSYTKKFFDKESSDFINVNGTHYETEISFIAHGLFNICGCTDEKGCLLLIRDVLVHFSKTHEKRKRWIDLIEDTFKESKPLAYLVISILDGRFLAHGTSIRYSWLTVDGQKLLEDLNRLFSE